MSELELYKFIHGEGLEIRWEGAELIVWVDFYSIGVFAEMVKTYLMDGVNLVDLQYNCIALDIVPICEHYDIDPENICDKEDNY